MTDAALKWIDDVLTAADINYEFGQWSSEVVPDPYFVGEYVESPEENEDGMQNTSFILTGTTKTSWLTLEQAKNTIKDLFKQTVILSNGNGIAVFYSDSLIVPVDDMAIKRIQINIDVKEWSVT